MQSAAIGLNKTECEIGRDGVGEVYIARDARPDRQLAIKASAEHLAQDPDRLARFQRETKVVTTLSHPSIDAIHGLELANGQPRALPAVSLSESTPEHEWVRST
jgi:serine/threonine protein kinase